MINASILGLLALEDQFRIVILFRSHLIHKSIRVSNWTTLNEIICHVLNDILYAYKLSVLFIREVWLYMYVFVLIFYMTMEIITYCGTL